MCIRWSRARRNDRVAAYALVLTMSLVTLRLLKVQELQFAGRCCLCKQGPSSHEVLYAWDPRNCGRSKNHLLVGTRRLSLAHLESLQVSLRKIKELGLDSGFGVGVRQQRLGYSVKCHTACHISTVKGFKYLKLPPCLRPVVDGGRWMSVAGPPSVPVAIKLACC